MIYCSLSVWLNCMMFQFKFSAELTPSLLICFPSECSDFRIALISELPYQMQSGSSGGRSVSSLAAWHFQTHPRMFLSILPVILNRWQFPRKFLLLSSTSFFAHRMPVSPVSLHLKCSSALFRSPAVLVALPVMRPLSCKVCLFCQP